MGYLRHLQNPCRKVIFYTKCRSFTSSVRGVTEGVSLAFGGLDILSKRIRI